MSFQHRLVHLLTGADPVMRRMLGYWAGTLVFYLFCMGLLWAHVDAGMAGRGLAQAFTAVVVGAMLLFYGAIRTSERSGMLPWHLALGQAVFAIAAIAAAYAVVGPVRGATLMILLVVLVFCSFALRPRQTRLLGAFAIVLLGLAMAWLAVRDPLRFPPFVEGVHFVLTAISVLAVSTLTGELSKLRSRLKRQKEELVQAVATIRTLATVDELTLLANRRHMHEVLSNEERRESALGRPVCMALIDIDFFKAINDRYGHAGGDAVLRAVASAARGELRAADMLARWGGEEFLLLLPDTELVEAIRVLERMAERIRAMRVEQVDAELRVTFSAGVVVRDGSEPFADAIRRADAAMYRAKSEGRNRILSAN